MRREVVRISAQVNGIKLVKPEFSKGLMPELGNGFQATPWQLNQEWVSNYAEVPPRIGLIRSEGIARLMDGDAASVIGSEDCYLKLQSFLSLAEEYNRGLAQLVYVFGSPPPQEYVSSPTLRRGASRQTAETFITSAGELLPRMREALDGVEAQLSDQLQAARAAQASKKL
jgi:hypothetical protein